MSAIARDAGVQRPTVQGYFQILKDTMLADLVYPLSLKYRTKEVEHPKFYFFDNGVVRTLNNLVKEDLEPIEKGFLLESFILNELRAYNRYFDLGAEIYYWGTHEGAEVDFIFSRGKKPIGFEIKSSTRWRNEDGFELNRLIADKKIQRGFGLYLGKDILKIGNVEVYPVEQFLEKIYHKKLQLF